jgi:formyl-CoA transferase
MLATHAGIKNPYLFPLAITAHDVDVVKQEDDQPLAELLVVALEQAVAAPFATRQLADLGARVVKIERTDGGDFARGYDKAVHGQSSYFVWLNRGKESVQLDLKSQFGRRALEALLAKADVLVHNLAPGAVDRLGLPDAVLRERYPKLINCVVTGYGRGSDWSDRKAYDLLVQCETGLASLTGSAAEAARVGVSIADIAAGMYAYSGVLTALLARARTGRGQTVEVSLFDALAEWMSQPAYYTRYGGTPPPRSGLRHATIAPYGAFATADGSQLLLSVQSEREWRVFCGDVLGDAGLAEDPRFASGAARVANRAVLDPLIADRLRVLDRRTAVKLLDDAGIANAGVNSVERFLEHDVLAQRHRWQPVGTPGGQIEALLPPVIRDGAQPELRDVPALGAHTASVLRELGMEAEE